MLGVYHLHRSDMIWDISITSSRGCCHILHSSPTNRSRAGWHSLDTLQVYKQSQSARCYTTHRQPTQPTQAHNTRKHTQSGEGWDSLDTMQTCIIYRHQSVRHTTHILTSNRYLRLALHSQKRTKPKPNLFSNYEHTPNIDCIILKIILLDSILDSIHTSRAGYIRI